MRANRTILATASFLATILTPSLGAAPPTAAVDQIVDGGFQAGGPSLELPAGAPFPLILGGWVARGEPLPFVVADPFPAATGDRAIRIVGAPVRPAHLIQDVALGHRGYVLQLEFLVESGRQSVRLLESWNRRDPRRGRVALGLEFDPAGLTVSSPAGTWRLERRLDDGVWHRLAVEADPRTALQTIALDGDPVLAVPGLPERAPGTLAVGATDEAPSRFLYDEIGVWRLADLELADLARRATTIADDGAADRFLDRLATAAVALRRGAVRLALPELRMARRLAFPGAAVEGGASSSIPGSVRGSRAGSEGDALRRAIDRLVELLES